jgi:hypothetical protein
MHRATHAPSLFLILTGILLSACAMQRAQDAEAAQKFMIGKTKEQVFACMGIPKHKATEGNAEIWQYKSGNDRTDRWYNYTRLGASRKYNEGDGISDMLSSNFGVGESSSESRFCIVDVIMSESRVTALHYRGPTGGFMTGDEQCAYATRNCAH